MGKRTRGYERIPELMALLMSDKYKDADDQPTLSVRKISELTGFPITLVQRDIALLVSNLYIGGYLIFENDKDMDTEEWVKRLNAGNAEACDERFYIDKDIFWYGEETDGANPVNLSVFEKNIFAKVLRRSDISDAVWVKETFTSSPMALNELRDDLQAAMQEGKCVTFSYDRAGEKQVIKDFSPLSIYETVENGQLYLVGFNTEGELLFNRLDHIRDMEKQEMLIPYHDRKRLEILNYMWGADASSDELEDVKIKIFNNTKNIIAKIKAVADGRKYAKLYQEPENDKVWYYEDTICGMNSFKKWLRSFGASVVVMEPLWLAEDMYKSAARRLEMYEKHKVDR